MTLGMRRAPGFRAGDGSQCSPEGVQAGQSANRQSWGAALLSSGYPVKTAFDPRLSSWVRLLFTDSRMDYAFDARVIYLAQCRARFTRLLSVIDRKVLRSYACRCSFYRRNLPISCPRLATRLPSFRSHTCNSSDTPVHNRLRSRSITLTGSREEVSTLEARCLYAFK